MKVVRIILCLSWASLIGFGLLSSQHLSGQQTGELAKPETTKSDKQDDQKTVQPSSTSATGTTKVESRKSSNSAKSKGEINFDDLQFKIEKDQPFKRDLLNKDVESLNGKKVKLRGYILPSTLFKETDIEQFVLVRDNQECCFGPGAALYDCVIVEMVPGKTTDFVTRPVTVEGKFKIDTKSYKYPGGVGPKGASHFAIFKIDGISVK
ncbi:MAG: DUF3299 domain-containing protein [Pirellulales bacterium]|nr:DUF3299 domain-containing protein [Pirellulales bacterium]